VPSRHEVTPAGALYWNARKRAQAKMLEFTITEADVEAAWPEDHCCPILGLPLERGIVISKETSATIDRIDPDVGYVPGNIAIISLRANRAKGSMRAGELEAIARWMRAHGRD
jgi:hypothetical protein